MSYDEYSNSAGGKQHSDGEYERLWLNELTAFTPQSRILKTWKPESYMDSGTFSRVFIAMHRETGKLAVLKYVPNPMKSANCRRKGSQEDRYNQERFSASQREAEIMSHFRGDKHIVQYLEEPEYLERTFENARGEMVTQYAVLICMPLYKNHKEWKTIVAGSRKGSLRLGIEISQALERFEEKGVYHRDIKPGNILMDDQYHFYLSDVGEAKLESEFTTIGFHGTRPYMAPEVYNQEGERGKMRSDHRSDIYSLGIILYRLFNHQQFPFMTEEGTLTEEATASYRQYRKKHQQDSAENSFMTDGERARILRYEGTPLPPPAEADAQLAEVILRACAYDKEKRYQTAADLTRALQCCAENKPLPRNLRYAGKAGDALAWLQAQPKNVKLAIGAAAVAVAVTVVSLIFGGGKTPPAPMPTATPVPVYAATAEPVSAPVVTTAPTHAPTEKPTDTPAPTPVPTDTPALIEGYAYTVKDNVQMRANASETALLQTLIRETGTAVEVIERVSSENKLWYLCTYGADVGYLYAGDLRAMTADEMRAYLATPVPTPTLKPTPEPTARPTARPTEAPRATEAPVSAAFAYKVNDDGDITITGYTGAGYAHVTIPDMIDGRKVTTIGEDAFEDSTITGLSVMGSNLRKIESGAFWSCNDLKTVSLPEGIENLAWGCFGYCSSLEELNIPSSVNSMSTILMGGNKLKYIDISPENNWITVRNGLLLTDGDKGYSVMGVLGEPSEVTIPGDIEVLWGGVFRDQDNLKNIVIPEGVTTIQERCFKFCSKLETVTLPSTLTSVEQEAFAECPKLKTIRGSGSVARNLAAELGVEFVEIMAATPTPKPTPTPTPRPTATPTPRPTATPRPANTPLSSAFTYETNSDGGITITGYIGAGNEHVTIPDMINGKKVTIIGKSAFEGSTITGLSVSGRNLRTIEMGAFWNCRSLKTVTLPEGLKEINWGAFGYCSALEELNIPASVNSMSTVMIACTNMRNLTVARGSEWISIKNGLLITNGNRGRSVMGVIGKPKDVAIPDNIQVLWADVFRDQDNLKRIDIPEGVKSIYGDCFRACDNLETVLLPSTVSTIEDNVFLNCTKLKTIYGSNSTARELAAELGIAFIEIPVKGRKSDKVLEIKDQLKALGYYSDSASYDNSFNDIMAARLKEFQKNNGLRETGRYDLDTMDKLNGGGNLVRGNH